MLNHVPSCNLINPLHVQPRYAAALYFSMVSEWEVSGFPEGSTQMTITTVGYGGTVVRFSLSRDSVIIVEMIGVR